MSLLCEPSHSGVAQDSVRLVRDGQFIGSTDMAELVEDSENFDDLPENAATAARAILSNIEDWVAHATAAPWPGERNRL